jgi:hypothetical protein
MGAAGLGVSPDSAKMAGSSANVAAAQRQALQPSETQRLQDVLRTRTLAREETTAEEAARQKAAGVSGLSSLQERVQQLVLAQMSQVTPPTTAAFTPDSSKFPPSVTGDAKDKLFDILTRHGTGKASPTDFSDAATILGITDITQVGPKLTELLKTTGAEIGGAGAAAIGDKLLITNEALIQMGTSAKELAGILGKETEDEILALTTDELVGQINNLAAKEYSRAEALRQIISDPNVGAAERQAAQEQLIGLGYAGVSAVESDMGRLNAELENANSVTINGETLSVSEILADSFLSSLIKDYLDNPTGDAAEYINSTPGLSGFKAFIDANRTALATTTAAMAEDVTGFAGIQTETAALRNNPVTGTGLSAQTADDMGIGTTGFVDKVPVPPPVVAYINDGEDGNGTVTNSLNNIAAIDGATDTGGIMAGIKIATQAELRASGFLNNATDYAEYVTTITALNSSSEDSAQDVLQSIFGDNFKIQGLEDELKRIRNFQKAGLITTTDPVMDLLDANRDGKLDSPDKLKAAFLGKISKDGRPMTIQEILAGGTNVTTLNQTIKDMIDGRKKLTTTLTDTPKGMTGPQWDSFRNVFEDGSLSDTEVSTLGNDTSITYVDLEALSKLPGASNNTALRDLIKTKRITWAKGIAQVGIDGMKAAPMGSDAYVTSAKSALDALNAAWRNGSDNEQTAASSYRVELSNEIRTNLETSGIQELAAIDAIRISLGRDSSGKSSGGMAGTISRQDSASTGERNRRNRMRDADRDYDNTIRKYYNYFNSLGMPVPSTFPKHPDRR